MLRIHFTSDDIARTRIAPAPDPLWELVLSLQMLRGQPGDLLFTNWRREVVAALHRSGLVPKVRQLLLLVPQLGYFPDFLNPSEAANGIDHGLEAIRSTGRKVLTRELYLLAAQGNAANIRSMTFARDLAEGRPEALADLTDVMRQYYEIAVSPYAHNIGDAVLHDRNLRIRAMAEAGLDGLLASLRPMMAWKSGELQVERHRDQAIWLDGRGLLLVPSYFCIRNPMTMFDSTIAQVLIYPILHSRNTTVHVRQDAQRSVSALIGRTRASMLEAVGDSCTTTELANRIGVSAASISEHISIMRDARLVTSYRDGKRVIHQTTALGRALIGIR